MAAVLPRFHGCCLLAAGVVASCTPDPELPIEYETEHLRIGTAFDEPFCQGDLVTFEEQISSTETELGVTMLEPYTVYIWPEQMWWAGPNDACNDELSIGCTHHSTNTIYTSWLALGHEITHAVIGPVDVDMFFEEALADIYGGDQTRFAFTAPSDNEGVSRDVLDVGTGSHFVRWLREEWGPEKLGELIPMSGSTFDNFEEVYGMPITEAEQIYFAEAPWGYPSLHSCAGTELPPVQPGQPWRAQVGLDCEGGDDTHSSGIGMIVHRTFVVEEAGLYSISTDGDWFDIYRCSPERIDIPPTVPGYLQDVPPHHAAIPSGSSRFYEGRVIHDLFMEAGRHDVGVGLIGYGTGTVTLTITPALGPQPATQG